MLKGFVEIDKTFHLNKKYTVKITHFPSIPKSVSFYDKLCPLGS